MLRVQYPGAAYHVMNRGDRREPIYADDQDRLLFLDTLAEACEKTDWQVAAITQHVPDKGAQMVQYYRWYSNKMRGVRQCRLPPECRVRRPGVSPPPVRLPSKHWRDLILRVLNMDPVRCPVSQNSMRVIAVVEDPQRAEEILRPLGAWHDEPAGVYPPGAAGP
jgi:hypothetical protein